jgi:cytochrome c oxidase assembly factor CtaG
MPLVVAVAAAYVSGVQRAWRVAGAGRIVRRAELWRGMAGFGALALSVGPTVDHWVDRSLTAHMVQHVVLMVVVAPLLALGGTVPGLVWALPDGARGRGLAMWRRVVASRRGAGWVRWGVGAVLVQAGVMWFWHAPPLYDAAHDNAAVHLLEHVSFVATTTVFWWAVAGRAAGRFGAVLVLFVGALPGTALGAALLLAPRPWYRSYPSLADQQLAGVAMWSGTGIAYVVAAAVLFAAWLMSQERLHPGVAVGSVQ